MNGTELKMELNSGDREKGLILKDLEEVFLELGFAQPLSGRFCFCFGGL